MVEIIKEIWIELLKQIASGGALSVICGPDRDPKFPCISTVYRYLEESPQGRADYAQARERQADTLAEQVLAIADTADPDGIAVSRLRCDVRRWYAGCVRPRQWGANSALALDAGSGAGITVTITRLDSDTAPDGTVVTTPQKPKS